MQMGWAKVEALEPTVGPNVIILMALLLMDDPKLYDLNC